MTPELWRRVDLILNRALDFPSGERKSFVESECVNDPELLAEVNTILAAHDDSQDLFEFPILLADQKLGSYRIVREIGRGGMGLVYLAERDDDQFQKQVAIKVLASTLTSGDLIRRFRRERIILASLEHPNIARLLDAGATERGVRYIVMEYVDGKRLDVYCREHNPSESDKLRLFQQICSAVQLAHRNLIVHRDIKPANILVTEAGIPKLLDFGIAKILSSDGADASDATVIQAMTPQYASPEQWHGNPVTTASDIYSLGLLLRELHTDASKRGKTQTLDIQAVIAKATREEPSERYASAEEMSAEIERYLGGLPVLARKRSARYLIQKFVRRHLIGVSAAMLALLLSVAAVFAIVRQSRIATRERARAQFRFEQVRGLARSMMYELHDGIVALPGSTAVRALLIQRSQQYLDSLAKEAEGDIGLQKELADSYRRLAKVQGRPGEANLGDPVAALASYSKSRAILERLVKAAPGNWRGQCDLIGVMCAISGVEFSLGRREEARATASEALRQAEAVFHDHPGEDMARKTRADALFEAALTEESQNTKAAWGRALVAYDDELARHPTDLEAIRNLARVHKYLQLANMDAREDWPESLRHGEIAYALDARYVAADPGNRQAKLDLTLDISQTAFVHNEMKEYESALADFKRIAAIRAQLVLDDPNDENMKSRLTYAKIMIGQTLLDLKRFDASAAAYREALELLTVLPAQTQKSLPHVSYLAWTHHGLARSYRATHQAESACREFLESDRAYVESNRLRPVEGADAIDAGSVAREARICQAR